MSVRAFQPRKVDPPQFVAEDEIALDQLVGGFIPGEQCDGCGNSSYRVEGAHGSWWAVCAVDPSDDPEFQHTAPCGARYAIGVWEDDLVTF